MVTRIVNHVTTIPDKFRIEKKLFKALFDDDHLVNPGRPKIPFARHSAISTPVKILGSEAAVTFLRTVLLSESAHSLLPEPLLKLVDDNLRQYEIPDKILKTRILDIVDTFVSPAAQKKIKQFFPQPSAEMNINFNVLAFRIFMICRMHELLTDDGSF